MKRILFAFFTCTVLFFSCKDEDYGWRLSHKEILSHCDKIIIKSQEKIIVDGGGYSYRPDGKIVYEIKNEKTISNFKNLFREEQRTGYCCCPDADFTIMFYERDNSFVYYYVDAKASTTKVRIYHPGFQYSYLIKKNAWKRFLDNLKTL